MSTSAPPENGRQRALPEGTIAIALGLVVNGVATYGFVIASRQALGQDRYSAIAVLWTIVFILGPGFFQPLEQEVSRISTDRATRGEGAAPVVRRAAIMGVGLFGVLATALAIAGPWMVRELFDGQWLLFAALLLTMAAFGIGELLRGVLSGYQRFGDYARYFGTEGLVRMVAALVLWGIGVEVAGPYGLIVASGPAIAVLVAGRGLRDLLQPGPEVPWTELRQALGFLLAASLFEAFLLNAGVTAVDLLASDSEEDAAGRFLNGLLMARVPLFFFQAVKASLLPKLVGLASVGAHREFRATLKRLLAFVAFIGTGGVIGAFLLGPWVVATAFDGDEIARSDMALLALSSAIFMVALSLALTLIALGSQPKVALGWVPGVILFPIIATSMSGPLFLRVEIALIASVTASALTMAVLCRQELAHRAGVS